MENDKKLKVLIVASEVAPFAKSGGLGDVAGSLPKALRNMDIDVRVVMPKYKNIKEEYLYDMKFIGSFETRLSWRCTKANVIYKEWDFPIYFIENDFYFYRDGLYGYWDDNERFAFFSKAALDMLAMLDFYPDIIHVNDWQAAPVCIYLKENYKKLVYYSKIKTLFTIHNLQYQGNFGRDTLDVLDVPSWCYDNGNIELYGQLSYMKAGLVYSDMISTVSKSYADEIQTPQYGYGLDGVLRSRNDRLCGILNGIDYNVNNPETDPCIFKSFGINNIEAKKENKIQLQRTLGLQERDVPVISVVSRLADQKGFDILAQVFEELMREDIQFIVLGTGESRYEYMFRNFANMYHGRLSANILFDDSLSKKIYAGSDMFLMPSLFEPCGLGQMFSLRYGTIPIVRKTGGLADTITHYNPETKQGNGFVFETYDGGGLLWAAREAIKVYNMEGGEWQNVVRNALECDFSWHHSAQEYIDLYKNIISE